MEVSTFRRAAPPVVIQPTEETTHKRPYYSEDEAGMVLLDNLFGTAQEDALRRDFTINALSYDIADFSVIDYSTGLSDLEQRLIRTIGDPRVRFTEDPVRMLRAVRFAASHDFVIEPVAWDILCELSPTISRASPARLYEEIQKLFLLGSARPAFSLLEKSGLLAALFPGLVRWIYERSGHLQLLETNLDYLGRLFQNGTPASPALFLAALFGPGLEDSALALHREGIPYRQALDVICEAFKKETFKIVSIPGRVLERLRAILALQASLQRTRPRRPASTAAKPEFSEALVYLRLVAETGRKHPATLEWWDQFVLNGYAAAPAESAADEPTRKRRRKRRRTRRGPRRPAL